VHGKAVRFGNLQSPYRGVPFEDARFGGLAPKENLRGIVKARHSGIIGKDYSHVK
jgi:hypothetical protein